MIDSFIGKYKFLSNFYWISITIDDIIYPTAEHAFQAAKVLNKEEKLRIATGTSAHIAKSIGRTVELRKDWENIKDSIMKNILTIKFKNEELKTKLLETEDNILIEGNYWHDNYWGNCTCEKCCDTGKNVLGTLLMEIRSELKKETSNE